MRKVTAAEALKEIRAGCYQDQSGRNQLADAIEAELAAKDARIAAVLERVRAVKYGMPCSGLARGIAEMLDPASVEVPEDYELDEDYEP